MRPLLAVLLIGVLQIAGCVLSCGATAPQPNDPPAPDPAPPADQTGGFDGARAFEHVRQLVNIGPRQSGTEGIRRAQEYIIAQLQAFGCAVETDEFIASTPVGPVPMKNILAKIAGQSANIVMLLTHYDTLRKAGFVGANDGGSSTGLMLEMARLLCGRPRAFTIWIVFLDGEEAFVQWSDTDGTYGSRNLAARMALSGDLARVKAVLLADMVGDRELRYLRETNSTAWLVDLVWQTASRLGYGQIFVADPQTVEDDHTPFLRRGVPAVDVIELAEFAYWHTNQDTLDKLSPRSLAVTGHVFVESLAALEPRVR